MRYLFGFICVLAGLLASPLSVSAQGDQRTEPALDLEWLEGSDLQWLQWLLEVEQDVAPDLLVQELRPPAPPSKGSWLRLELDHAGMRVVPRPRREEGRPRAFRVGVGVSVSLAVVAVGAAVGAVAAFSGD